MSGKRLPRDVTVLGVVSLFMDVSSELIHGLLPGFLVATMGMSLASIGLLEGFAEATALSLKVFSGAWSDKMGRRKPLVVAGYALGAISKPLFAIAGTPVLIFGARFLDRMGKGIRGAPRDALIADVVEPSMRGRAFGLRQSLDTVGAFVGPALGIGLMVWTHNAYRTIFWLAAIPGLLSVAVLVIGVREPSAVRKTAPLRLSDAAGLGSRFWTTIALATGIQFARLPEAFLLLRARDAGLPAAYDPSVLIGMNVIFAGSALPFGALSDRIRREWLLVAGMAVLAGAECLLAAKPTPLGFAVGVGLWGLQMGLSQGVLSAFVADACPADRRGTAFGLFGLTSAAAVLTASSGTGWLWDRFGAHTAFVTAAAASSIVAVWIALARRPFSKS